MLRQRLKHSFRSYKFVIVFFLLHVALAIAIGPTYIFAPDEQGYLYTLNNLYGASGDANPQFGSGWISTSKPFLWLAYLPAKVLMMLHIPDYLALRFLSILTVTLCLLSIQHLQRQSGNLSRNSYSLVLWFSIPSIFIWSTFGLREPFLITELGFILVGSALFTSKKQYRYLLIVFIGSYGLLATKNYQWIILCVSVMFASIFLLLTDANKKAILKFLVSFAVLPLLAYVLTTPSYSLQFIFHVNSSAISERSGDSIIEISIPEEFKTGNGTGNGTGNIQSTVRIHGGTTLVSFYEYLKSNPNSLIARIMNISNLNRLVKDNYNKRILESLEANNSKPNTEDKSYILHPSTLNHPLLLLKASAIFLLGPLPFSGEFLSTRNILSLETPIWWALLIWVFIRFIRANKREIFSDLTSLIALLYSGAVVISGGMLEVNLGTSFRHRSMLFIPLLFLLIKFRAIRKEQLGTRKN